MVQRFLPSAHAQRGHGSPTRFGSVSSCEGSFRFAPHPDHSSVVGPSPSHSTSAHLDHGATQGAGGPGAPRGEDLCPCHPGVAGKRGPSPGRWAGTGLEGGGDTVPLFRGVCPKAGPRYPGGTTDWSPGVLGCSVLLGANLKIPGSSGDGEHPDPYPDAASLIMRSPGVLSRAV